MAKKQHSKKFLAEMTASAEKETMLSLNAWDAKKQLYSRSVLQKMKKLFILC